MRQRQSVVILGGGLQGVCAALALAGAGWRVRLIEREAQCLSRASMANEGKIHLGFVYAGDDGGSTPLLMLEGALSFAPLLERWLGPVPWHRFLSRPFVYVVARESMLPVDRVRESYTQLQAHYEEKLGNTGIHYLGQRPERLWDEVDDETLARIPASDFANDFLQTRELSVDPRAFRAFLIEAMKRVEGVEILCGHEAKHLSRTPAGFRVEGVRPDGSVFRTESGVLVNCTWEQRLGLDQQLGVPPPRPWVHRLKLRLSGRLPPALRALPSFTYVLGPFGDIVSYGDGSINLSWYPACRIGWSDELVPPRGWDDAYRGRLDTGLVGQVTDRTLNALDDIVPGIRGMRVDHVGGGVIFAWGDSDIDVTDSRLHDRRDIGVEAHDGYFSINTGKLTTAPLFASHLLDHLA